MPPMVGQVTIQSKIAELEARIQRLEDKLARLSLSARVTRTETTYTDLGPDVGGVFKTFERLRKRVFR